MSSLSAVRFCVKLLRDLLCDLTLDREHVLQIAIILLNPDVCVGASVDQMGVDVKPGTRLANTTRQDVRDSQRFPIWRIFRPAAFGYIASRWCD